MEYSSRTSKPLRNVKDGHFKDGLQSRISLVTRWKDMNLAESQTFSLADFNLNPSKSTSGGSNDLGVGLFRGNVYASDSDETITMESGQWQYSDEPSLIIVSKTSKPSEQRPSRPLENECSEDTAIIRFQTTPNSEKEESPFAPAPPMHNIDFSQFNEKNYLGKLHDSNLRDQSPVVVDDSIKVLLENSIPPNRLVYTEDKRAGDMPLAKLVTFRTIPLNNNNSSTSSDGEKKMFEAENRCPTLTRTLTISEMPRNDSKVLAVIEKQLTQTVERGDKIGLTVLNLDQLFSKHSNSLGNILGRAPRILSLISMYGNEKWFRVCCNLRGRTLPWQPMTVLVFWIFVLYLIHSYGLGLLPGFRWKLSTWMYKVLGVSVGFLLKQHATIANDRWMEARKIWEDIIDNTRTLVIIFASTSECSKLMREAISHVIGCPICIKNYVMGVEDDAWRAELMMILPLKNCERVMGCKKRMRATFCLYACQRVVETMIKYQLLQRPVVRDINPRVLKLSHFAGDCARIRYTQVPYGYFIHIRLLLVAYLMFLPLLLLGIKGISWDAIILYLLLISYAYAGLESMATQILNPFDRDESDHPLDLYCYLNVTDTRYMVGKGFGERSNFVKSFENSVKPIINRWLKDTFTDFTEILSIPKKPKGWRTQDSSTIQLSSNEEIPEVVTKSTHLPFNELSELIYELYSEEKADQEERGRKRRIREHRKQLSSGQEMLFKGLL